MTIQLSGLLLLSLSAPLFAQEAPVLAPQVGPPTGLDARLAEWRADSGAAWRTHADPATGYAEHVFGGSTEGTFRAARESDYGVLALDHIARAKDLLGLELDTLVVDEISYLPFAITGGRSKVAVRLTQVIDGIPVATGSANVLMTPDGELLALESKALPGLSGFNVVPTRSAAEALERAAAEFRFQTRRQALEVSAPKLVVAKEMVGKLRRPALAWEIDLQNVTPAGAMAYRVTVSADGQERIISAQNQVHQAFDVGGQVLTNATPGSVPDTAGAPAVPVPAAYMTVTSSAGTTTTDANGFFNYAGVNGPLDVTFRYEGLYNDVANFQGSEHVVTQPLSGTGNSVTMNPSPTELVTSQSNVFVSINTMRDWVRATNPSDSIMDAINIGEVNSNFFDAGSFVIDSCNAVFLGAQTLYFESGGGCVNTAYSTVVAHEQGHWLNVRYNSGNGSDGFGEGNADVYAMYLFNTPLVGEGFFGPGSTIRTGLNNNQFCGDASPGCFGAVHTDGEVLMGAMWKMRANLQATHGDALGGQIADGLFLGWMNAYDQGEIKSVIVTQMLTLDDNDGDIGNGTPNYEDINSAFQAQGFPGVDLQFIELQTVATAGDTFDQVGPYGVAVTANPLEASGIASVDLFVEGLIGFLPTPMTNVSGNTWTGFIAGKNAPNEVRYFVRAEDTLGNVEFTPDGGASNPLTFQIGEKQSFFFDDFETGTDNGWTHAQLATQDDWQRGNPSGKGGSAQGVSWSDPGSATSGTRVWGNDIGPDGFNGSYQTNVINFLRSPQINLASAGSATLRFNRWLTVEQGQFDQAQIRVDNQVVWENPFTGNLVDTDWQDFQLDISQFAGDSSVQLEFRLESDGGLELGGWNIDDVQIFSLDGVPTDCQPSLYGSGLAGSNGLVPQLDSGGRQSQIGSVDFALEFRSGLPNSLAYLAYGPASATLPLLGGTLLVSPNVVLPVNLDVLGAATLPAPLPNDPGLVGSSLYAQGFVVDGGAPENFSITRGLQLTFCN